MTSKLILLVSALVTLTASGQQKPTYTDSEAEKHVGEEARVTGKLVNVFTSGSGTTFLNLGDRFPRQTFGAVIFASQQAKVGDVKQYEGKDVVLTGRIELSKDQKPQIIINSADQIQVAGAVSPAAPTPVAAPTMPATPVPPTGAPPPASPEPAPIVEKQTGKIQLTMGWNSPQNGGEMARKDLAKLFGLAGSANDATLVDASFEVYPGIRFLTPVNVARKILKLETAQYIKSKVETSGFPQDTLNTHTFGGVFPGGFTRLVLVTDSTDQIVSVLSVDSSPRTRVENVPDTTGYHTYNFISGSGKASNDLQIKHQIRPDSIGTNVIVVDTLLIDPEDQSPSRKTKSSSAKSSSFSRQKTGKVLESSRWYVPAPIVNLILHCVGG
jgi:hypothetical protein